MPDLYLTLALAEGFGEQPIPSLLGPGLDPAATLAQLICDDEPLPDVPLRVLRRLQQEDLGARAAAVRRRAAELGLCVLTPDDADWPERLGMQPLAPLVLFVRGDATVLSRAPSVAVVGSRTPTPYGLDAAGQLTAALAHARVVVWSGLARGVDGVAHRTCVEAGTPTVAVLAGGLDSIYPPEHADLADAIVACGGCLVSELPPGMRARRGHFVRRNRLVAAGATALVVVEGGLASGAMHTARFAAECDTEVFALPGPWHSERSQGCHRLIAEGAGIVESPQALLQMLGVSGGISGPASLRLATCAEEAAILEQLGRGPRPGDLLRRECGLDHAAFLRALFALQQRGLVASLPGDLWRRTRGHAPGTPLC